MNGLFEKVLKLSVLIGIAIAIALPGIRQQNKFQEVKDCFARARYPVSWQACLNDFDHGLQLLGQVNIRSLSEKTRRELETYGMHLYIESTQYDMPQYPQKLRPRLLQLARAETHPLRAAELLVPTIQNGPREAYCFALIAESYLALGQGSESVRLAQLAVKCLERDRSAPAELQARIQSLQTPPSAAELDSAGSSFLPRPEKVRPPEVDPEFEKPSEWPTPNRPRPSDEEYRALFKKSRSCASAGDLELAYISARDISTHGSQLIELKLVAMVEILVRYTHWCWKSAGNQSTPDPFLFRLLKHCHHTLVKWELK